MIRFFQKSQLLSKIKLETFTVGTYFHCIENSLNNICHLKKISILFNLEHEQQFNIK